MSELRSAALLCFERKGDRVPRVMIFDDHNDAYDTMKALDQSQYRDVWMVHFEHYAQGQKPANLPDQQEAMFK